MNFTTVIIGKFLILLGILTVSLLPVFGWMGFSNSVFISSGLGVLYLIAGSYEVILKKNRISGDYFRVTYLPFLVISKRIIRVFFFLVLTALMIAPETMIYWLVTPLAVITIGEVIFFLIGIKKECFSILFFGDFLFFMLDKEKKVFAKEITHIEYRYENFYLVLVNRSTIKINPEWMKQTDRKNFHDHFMSWAQQNAIPFTEEALAKLGQLT